MDGKTKKMLLAGCLAAVVLCIAAGRICQLKMEGRVLEMEQITVSNRLYHFVQAMETYGSNLQILVFEREDPTYAYKLHEALGMIKYGSATLSYETYGEMLPDDLTQALRELSRQLSNFTYRFMDDYPYLEGETEVLVSELARRVGRTARILDNELRNPESEAWVSNPAQSGEWMIDKGYRIDKAACETIAEEVRNLLEENEKAFQQIFQGGRPILP